MNTVDPLFQIKVTCSCCESTFHTSRVRPSWRVSASRDADFCIHYKDPENNPDFYVVRVCPYCGYASTENTKPYMTEQEKKQLAEKVTLQWTSRDYGGKRTWEEALATYQLALLCAQITNESDRIIASLLHHIAWLYRYQSDTVQEERFLQFAKEAYIRVYEFEEESVNQARLMYMIGELSRRLKQYHEAIQWFGRVINDIKIMDSAMIQASREQWGITREDMLREKLELPEEMLEQQ